MLPLITKEEFKWKRTKTEVHCEQAQHESWELVAEEKTLYGQVQYNPFHHPELFFQSEFLNFQNISFKLFVRRINDGTISLMIIASQVEEAVIGGLRPAVIYQVRLLHTLASLEDAPTWNTLCASSKLTLAGQVDPGPLFLPPRPPWQGTHSCLRGDQW